MQSKLQDLQLLTPVSKEHALIILQEGLRDYQRVGRGSFNMVSSVDQQSDRMSFNEPTQQRQSQIRQHPKVHNIFEQGRRRNESENIQVSQEISKPFDPPQLYSAKSAKSVVRPQIRIPEQPQGRMLTIKVLSNWGDKVHTGLNGIELFDAQGANITRYVKFVEQEDVQLKCRLTDGYFAVKDDDHLWLTKHRKCKILIDLTMTLRLSMIRVWNYNKSRTHSNKGVRLLEISMDSTIIFSGHIRKASGDLKKFQDNCEFILLTNDEKILNRIAEQDWLNQRAIDYSVQILQQTFYQERPTTGSKSDDKSPKIMQSSPKIKEISPKIRLSSNKQEIQQYLPSFDLQDRDNSTIQTNDIILEFYHSTKRPIGINGIELLDQNNNVIKNSEYQIYLQGQSEHDNLLYQSHTVESQGNYNNQYLTTNSIEMIMLRNKRSIHIKLRKVQQISSLKLYNFNQSINKSAIISADLMRILYNGKSQTEILRPSPQCDKFDFGQLIQLGKKPDKLGQQNNYYVSPQQQFMFPVGMLVQINLISTWGDQHYIGLNGIECYDSQGQSLLLKKLVKYQIQAIPQLYNDARVVSNLCSPPYGKNCTPKHSFLAPFINTPQEQFKTNSMYFIKPSDLKQNKIFILFENTIQFSAIDFYNYTKNIDRGTREVHLYVNNKLVYQGYIQQSTYDDQHNLTNRTTIMLSNSQQIAKKIQAQEYQMEIPRTGLICEGIRLNSMPEQQTILNDNLYRPPTRAK